MNERERYRATAAFAEVDRAFLLPPWAWEATVARWKREGLAEGVPLSDTFQTDREEGFPIAMQGRYGPHLHPPLERKVLAHTSEHVVVRDEEGNVVRLMRDDPLRSMPEWIAYPMKDRSDWEHIIKPRLDPRVPGRGPEGAELDRLVAGYTHRDVPLTLWCGSFYGWPRSFMGVERMSLMLYDDPGLVHEMCEHIADFVIETITPLLGQRVIRCRVHLGRHGRQGGAAVLAGAVPRVHALPAEAGHRPPPSPRRAHHHRGQRREQRRPHPAMARGRGDGPAPVRSCGGVRSRRRAQAVRQGPGHPGRHRQARAGAGTKAGIEREVLSKVPWLCLQGGYFPQVDHLVPPDVPLENYRHYAALIRAVVEDPQRYLQEAKRIGAWDR